MLEFNKKMMITGAEQRNKKDGSTYILVHVLGGNGQTFACMYKGDANKIMQLEKMKEYDLSFVINIGQYTHVNIADINIVK